MREFTQREEPLVQLTLDIERRGEGFEAWFEAAIEGCAYLTWNLTQRGARVRLRTQRIDLRIPEDGDVYTVLRYLALVEPLAPGSAKSDLFADNHEASPLEVLLRRRSTAVAPIADGASAAG